MAGLFSIFGTNKHLCALEEHSNCHVVIDGSNLQYFFSSRAQALTNLPAYKQAAEHFFQQLLDAGITPHVFFDGPSRGDPYKWERGRKRREDRLEKLVHHTSDKYKFEYPQPTAVQDIFRDVVHSFKEIRSIQVSAKRDYTLEMILHAKQYDAFLISANTKFFLENIPGGFVCPTKDSLLDFRPAGNCIFKTFRFDKLSRLLRLAKSPNPYALTMWRIVMFNQETFKEFTKQFFPNHGHRGEFYPRRHVDWISDLLSTTNRKVCQLKMLQFFLENSYSNAEKIVCNQLFPDQRREARLFFQQNVAAQLLESYDVFERIEEQIDSGEFCEEDLPRWFLHYLTDEVKVIPGLMDTFTDRKHHLMVFLEDYNRESVNKTTLRLRRIIYGILFADCEDHGEVIKVTELDRVKDTLEEFEVIPIRQLWNPANRLEPRELPGLKPMETLSAIERVELFLLSMGVDEGFHRVIESEEALYVTVILKYWAVASAALTKKDLLRLLLTVLFVEAEYSKLSKLFREPVQLKENARSDLQIDFRPSNVVAPHESLSVMHPHSQFQNVVVFARTLHRLFRQPLGATVDGIETITSEVVFYQIANQTKDFNDDEVRDFVLDQIDEESKENFEETVDLIWNDEARRQGRRIVQGFRGDDKRP